jgi:diguanylate cyclase (GGDEF)-like protein
MISLKKYIESPAEHAARTLCQSYRDSLTAIGVSATQVCPHVGEDFQRDLGNLRDQLTPGSTPEVLELTGKQVQEQLTLWGETASGFLQQTAQNVKEIMLTVAETAQAVVERDQRYAQQFGEFAGQLAAIGNLDDIAKIRQSLGNSATQLKASVARMVEDGDRAVSRLRSELSEYQQRLDEVERVATQDPVTGVANRYKAERQIELRISRGRGFAVAIFDLDHFKQINDVYGHAGGDTLLKQFAAELRSAFRATDTVSRWGGDEFLVIVDCAGAEAAKRIETARKWVDGDYTVQAGNEARKVAIRASVGVASWLSKETPAELVARADAAMYQEKVKARGTEKAPASR